MPIQRRPWFQSTVLQYVPERILQKSKITYGQVPIKAAALCCGGGEVQKAFITWGEKSWGREYEKLVTSWSSAACLDHEDLIYEDWQTVRLFIADSKEKTNPSKNKLVAENFMESFCLSMLIHLHATDCNSVTVLLPWIRFSVIYLTVKPVLNGTWL